MQEEPGKEPGGQAAQEEASWRQWRHGECGTGSGAPAVVGGCGAEERKELLLRLKYLLGEMASTFGALVGHEG